MSTSLLPARDAPSDLAGGAVEVVTRAELARCPHWLRAFAGQRKDHRFYELVEDTIRQGFEYRYFAIKDARGEVRAIQPFFLLDQDILAGVSGLTKILAAVRRLWPRFMTMRTLMVGCAAGEGRIDGDPPFFGAFDPMPLLASALAPIARELGARLIVLKEFPAEYRDRLCCFEEAGFARAPSMPMTRLDIQFDSFDDYAKKTLSANTRRNLRRKFEAAERGMPIEMSVVRDIGSVIGEVYPLYLQVFERSRLRFEKLTPEFFLRLGRTMPEKTRFFLWRQDGRLVAFALCMVQDDEIFGEYLGLDYRVALDLHLYYCVMRDVISWAIENGYARFRSGGLNYDPKLRMGHRLDPLDLYVRHTSPWLNRILKFAIPLIEPTRRDATLAKFPNYPDLRGGVPPRPLRKNRRRPPRSASGV